MGSEAFRVTKKPINHGMNFVQIYVMVIWQELLSEELVEYRSVPPKFAVVRQERGDLIDAEPGIRASDMDLTARMVTLQPNRWDTWTAGVYGRTPLQELRYIFHLLENDDVVTHSRHVDDIT
jgi:hypothetical protein